MSEEKIEKVEEEKTEEKTEEQKKEEKTVETRGQMTRGRGPRVRKTEEELREDRLKSWVPKTIIGKKVMAGDIKNIDEILDTHKILEAEIVESLLNLKSDFLAIGEGKGKFGGGK